MAFFHPGTQVREVVAHIHLLAAARRATPARAARGTARSFPIPDRASCAFYHAEGAKVLEGASFLLKASLKAPNRWFDASLDETTNCAHLTLEGAKAPAFFPERMSAIFSEAVNLSCPNRPRHCQLRL